MFVRFGLVVDFKRARDWLSAYLWRENILVGVSWFEMGLLNAWGREWEETCIFLLAAVISLEALMILSLRS